MKTQIFIEAQFRIVAFPVSGENLSADDHHHIAYYKIKLSESYVTDVSL